jgi:hypothetical protein
MCVVGSWSVYRAGRLQNIYSIYWSRKMILSKYTFWRGLLWPFSKNCAYIGLNWLRDTTKTHNCPDSKNVLPESFLLFYCHINLHRDLKIWGEKIGMIFTSGKRRLSLCWSITRDQVWRSGEVPHSLLTSTVTTNKWSAYGRYNVNSCLPVRANHGLSVLYLFTLLTQWIYAKDLAYWIMYSFVVYFYFIIFYSYSFTCKHNSPNANYRLNTS